MFNWIPKLIDNLQNKENERQRNLTEEPVRLPNHDSWRKFPLGFALVNTEIFWDPYDSAHLYAFGKYANMLSANIVRHCAKHPDNWLVYVVDYNGVNVPRTKEFDTDEIEYLQTIEETHETISYLQEEMHSRLEQLRSWNYGSILEQRNPLKSILAIITVPHWIFLPSGVKTDEGINLDQLREEMNIMIDDVLHNGTKAGVHLAIMDENSRTIPYGDKIKHIATRVLLGDSGSEMAEYVLGADPKNIFYLPGRGQGYIRASEKGLLFEANQYSVNK